MGACKHGGGNAALRLWPQVEAGLLLGLAVLVAGNAAARDSHAGFNVKVHVVASAHAAAIPKSAPSPEASGKPAMNELRFGITSGAGYFIRFRIVDPAVEEVRIHGLGPVIRIESGARDVFVPSGRSGQSISYEVKLRPGSEPTVAAPVRAVLLP